MGVRVENDCLSVNPFLSTESDVTFTLCTVPIEIREGVDDGIRVTRSNGELIEMNGLALDAELSTEIFGRTGAIGRIEVTVK